MIPAPGQAQPVSKQQTRRLVRGGSAVLPRCELLLPPPLLGSGCFARGEEGAVEICSSLNLAEMEEQPRCFGDESDDFAFEFGRDHC